MLRHLRPPVGYHLHVFQLLAWTFLLAKLKHDFPPVQHRQSLTSMAASKPRTPLATLVDGSNLLLAPSLRLLFCVPWRRDGCEKERPVGLRV